MNTIPADLIGKHALIMNPISEQYDDTYVLATLQEEFLRHDYVKLPGLLQHQAFQCIRSTIEDLQSVAVKHSFIMDGYETPREMSTIGGLRIIKESSVLWTLYSHHQIRNLIEKISGAEVYSCPHPNEFMVVNYLFSTGATHGWHLDDPSYALVIIIEGPSSAEHGGTLEFIPNWAEFCTQHHYQTDTRVEPLTERATAENLVQTGHHLPGDAYLLRADRCLHRVTALEEQNMQRIVLNLAYDTVQQKYYGETANKLYKYTEKE